MLFTHTLLYFPEKYISLFYSFPVYLARSFGRASGEQKHNENFLWGAFTHFLAFQLGPHWLIIITLSSIPSIPFSPSIMNSPPLNSLKKSEKQMLHSSNPKTNHFSSSPSQSQTATPYPWLGAHCKMVNVLNNCSTFSQLHLPSLPPLLQPPLMLFLFHLNKWLIKTNGLGKLYPGTCIYPSVFQFLSV